MTTNCIHEWERNGIVEREGMQIIVEYYCVICDARVTEREEMDV